MNAVKFSKKILALCCLILNISFHAWGQNFVWACQWGNLSIELGNAIALDASSNVYTTGSFGGTSDFDPGPGVFNLTPTLNMGEDVYLSKLDSSKNLLWAINMGGGASDQGWAVAVDGALNVYVAGTFSDSADFDPGPGTSILYSSGNSDVFIAKYDASGAYLWAKKIGGAVHEFASSMDVDAAGNVYITGDFRDTVDFDPGPGIFQRIAPVQNNIFIVKLDVSGNFVWANSIGNLTYNYGVSIKLDPFGGVYTTGTFRQTVDFDPGAGIFNLTSSGYDDVFIYKSDTAGHFIWAKGFGGASYDFGRGITIDASGNVITTGSFNSIVDFDPGNGVYNITQSGIAGSDIFISKVDSAGNFIWAKQFGGVGEGFGAAISTDNLGNIYASGHFDGVTDFNPGAGVLNFTASGTSKDIYILKLSAAGNLGWARQVGGTGNDYSRGIAADNLGNVFYTGFFYGTVDFDPGVGIYNLSNPSSYDVYVSKLGDASTGIHEVDAQGIFTVTPNPASDQISVQSNDVYHLSFITIRNLTGQTVCSHQLQHVKAFSVNISHFEPGMYIIELQTEENNTSFLKLIVN